MVTKMIKVIRRCTIVEIDQKSRCILTRYHSDDQPDDAAPWDIWSEDYLPVVSFDALRVGMQMQEIVYRENGTSWIALQVAPQQQEPPAGLTVQADIGKRGIGG